MTLGNYAGEGYLLHPSGICPMLWDYESFSVSERRAQMVVLGLLLTPKQKHPQPKWQGNVPCSCEQITPNSSQSAQVYTTHSTNISSLHSQHIPPTLLVMWAWMVSSFGARWEWEGAWPKQSCHSSCECKANVRLAMSQISHQQSPIESETKRSPPLWCFTRTSTNPHSRKSPGVSGWFLLLLFFTQMNWKTSG